MLILAMLFAIGLFWNQGKSVGNLQKRMAELDRSEPGWHLRDIEAARAELPERDNSARVVMAAVDKLPRPWPAKELDEERFRSLPSNEKLSGEDFVLLSTELTKARAALDVAAQLADMPRGRHRLEYARNPIATLLPHLQECRRIASLLAYESMRWSQKGDSGKALTACRAAVNAGRSIGDEPIYISQMVRNACVILACQAVERTLAQGEPPSEEMIVLQKLLEDEDTFPSLLLASRGERASMHELFEAVQRGELSVNELSELWRGGPKPDWMQDTFISLWRMNTSADHALYLSLMARRIRETQLPMHEQAALEKTFEQDVRTLPKNAVITRELLPAVAKLGESFRRKHALLRCILIALAAERYRRDKEAWPDNIDQICPQYLTSVLLDPFDGKSLRYRRVEDGIIIYSVGQDAVDDGGNLGRERPTMSGVDIGYRLWDVAQRRRPPQPKQRNEEKPR